LTALLSAGKHPVCKLKQAQILLADDQGMRMPGTPKPPVAFTLTFEFTFEFEKSSGH